MMLCNHKTWNPLSLSNDTVAITANNMGFGKLRLDAIFRCRKVLDKYRGSYFPSWIITGNQKIKPYYLHGRGFRFMGLVMGQDMESYWYLPTEQLWQQALDEMGEDDLYLALYGEKLKS